MATTISGYDYTQLNGGGSLSQASTAQEVSDRFLRLLVAQVQNQDPLAPMDNAQVTSQMAQINTVTGIEKLNTSVESLSGQFVQMQMLQGATLVGHDVVVPGNRVTIADGVGAGGFELAGSADSVEVEVLGASGQVIDRIDMGALGAGSHDFQWNAGAHADAENLTFRIKAKAGSVDVSSTPLNYDRVAAVSTQGGGLTLELERSGPVAYSQVRAIN